MIYTNRNALGAKVYGVEERPPKTSFMGDDWVDWLRPRVPKGLIEVTSLEDDKPRYVGSHGPQYDAECNSCGAPNDGDKESCAYCLSAFAPPAQSWDNCGSTRHDRHSKI